MPFKNLINFFARAIEIPTTTDPEDARRRKLLNILLVGVGGLTLLIVPLTLVAVFLSGGVFEEGVMSIFVVALVMLLAIGLFYAINRSVSGQLSGSMFLVFLTFIFAFADTPDQVANGRSLILFTIPIVFASILLSPASSFLFATLASFEISLISFFIPIFPNIPAIAAFYALALVSWLSSRSLEQALKELRGINTNLDRLVSERTEELRDAIVSLGIEAGRSQAILNGIADGVIVFDAGGKAIIANPAISKLLDISVREIIGATFNDLIAAESVSEKSRLQVQDLIQKTGSNLTNFRIEIGRKVLSTSAARVKDGNGSTIGTVVVVRDFTKEAEVERMKNAFVAIVSHELRTPLNAISGYAEMLREGVYGRVTDKQVGAFDRIISNTQRLMHIVNDLLDQAQIEAGKLTIRMRPFKLSELLDNVHGVMDKIAADRGLALTSEIVSAMPAMISGDPYRLQQILVNLVNNAVKFTDRGRIHIRIYTPNQNYWAMDVSDTGRGIPTESLQTIFEAFKQIDSGTTREHGGVGLGLSIVKNLSRLMGGDVTVTSKLGEGSVFTVILPLVITLEEKKNG